MAQLKSQLSVRLLVLRLAIALLTARVTFADQQLYAVVPEGGICHYPFESCHPLKYYISDTEQFFTTNVSMVFLPGEHVMQSGSVSVLSIHNLQMISYFFYSQNYSNDPQIMCSNHSGFNFTNVSNLVIGGLMFVKCEQLLPHNYAYHHTLYYAGLTMKNVVNLIMQNVTVLNSTGLGLNAENIFGHSQLKNCLFRNNHGSNATYGGNAQILYYNCDNTSAYISLQSSTFEYGYQYLDDGRATGLLLSVDCRCSNITIELDEVLLKGNKGFYGGNMGIYFYNCHHSGCVKVSLLNSLVEHGESRIGGGIFIKIDDSHWDGVKLNNSFSNNTIFDHIHTLLYVQNTSFFENKAHATGGAVYSEHSEVENASRQIQMSFTNCDFSLNTAVLPANFPHGGAAILLLNYHVSSFVPHIYPQFAAAFGNCTFSRNYRYASEDTTANALSAVLYLEGYPHISLSNSTFIDNKCTAIIAVHSNIIFGGDIVIRNNTGGNGGGLVLCDQSFVAFENHTRVEIVYNKAKLGGGIYIGDSCLDARTPCFFQIDSTADWQLSDLNEIMVYMEGNNATYGTAIYGGNIDYCFMFWYNLFHSNNTNGTSVFTEIFHIVNATSDLTSVTSDPIGICFCSNQSLLSETCKHRDHSGILHVDPGGYIELSVVVIGQRWGTVAGSVLATIQATHETTNTTFSYLKKISIQKIEDTKCKQTNLRYRIFSPPTKVSITLEIQDSNNNYDKFSTLNVNVSVDDCPLGFKLNKTYFGCECNDVLNDLGYHCNITERSYSNAKLLARNTWIGFMPTSEPKHIVYSHDCPLYYCNSKASITADTPDLQCNNNRSGLICGKCCEGYSVVMGSSKCKKCSNVYLLLVLLLFVGGFLLIAFLLACNITVTTGTLSGLIFYANTLDIHRYLIAEESSMYAKLIIAILNLDFNSQMCFYNGMNEYQKQWLEFIFPVYLLFLAGLLIVLSRKYNFVSRIVRRNGTHLLATLILLSYTKLTRSILQVLIVGKYEWKESNEHHISHIWRLDGNINYWSSKHTVCFVVSLIMSLVFIIPYTLVLTFIQPLQKVNLRCINYFLAKFKPLLDAYTAPYKDAHRFWPGLLLVFRLLMFTGYIYNEELPVVVVVAVFIILFFMWSFHGVYKVPLLDALETSFYLNVGMLALLRIKYEKGYKYQYGTLILISITIATTEFLLIIFYEIHNQLLALSRYRSAWNQAKRKLWRNILRRNADQNEVRNDATNERPLEGFPYDFPPVIRFDCYREPLLSSDGTIDTH